MLFKLVPCSQLPASPTPLALYLLYPQVKTTDRPSDISQINTFNLVPALNIINTTT